MDTIEKEFQCPFCGEEISCVVDLSVPHQKYIEDCSVCCRPIQIEASVEISDSAESFDCNENAESGHIVSINVNRS